MGHSDILIDLKTTLKKLNLPTEEPLLGISSEERFGDYSSTIALRLSKVIKQPAMVIAKEIESNFPKKIYLDRIEVASPGFINFYLSAQFWQKELREILEKGDNFGSSQLGKDKRWQVEFISANPTGPLTLGNGRGGFIGDCLAKVLTKVGYDIEREYYLNDRGVQVDVLGESVAYAIAKLQGENVVPPDYLYKGDYILDLAKELGDFKNPLKNTSDIRDQVLPRLINEIQQFVQLKMKIEMDSWFSEKSLYDSSQVKKTKLLLEKSGLVYEKEGSTWLKTTAYGDDKDRVLIKSDGEPTYFLSDIAYHYDKFERGFEKVIDIWGADHHGYIERMQAAMRALREEDKLEIIIVQLVRLIKNGAEVKMSKRAGVYVTLEELLNEVGLDATRFFFLSHASNTHMDFDLNLAKEQSQKNPVYYVQYAHARISSILKRAKIIEKRSEIDYSKLDHPCELKLIKKLAQFPVLLENIAVSYSVYQLPFYSIQLADLFHKFYTERRVLTEDKLQQEARLQLIKAVSIVLKNTLGLMGITAPEKM